MLQAAQRLFSNHYSGISVLQGWEAAAACPAEDYVKLGELFQEKEAAEEALLLLYEEEEA